MRLLEEGRVALSPGSAFGPSGEGYVRISYASSIVNLKKGVDRSRHMHETVFEVQAEIITKLVQKEPCIIVGRCADYAAIHEDHAGRDTFSIADSGRI